MAATTGYRSRWAHTAARDVTRRHPSRTWLVSTGGAGGSARGLVPGRLALGNSYRVRGRATARSRGRDVPPARPRLTSLHPVVH
jgi:hypothetical protein